MRILVTGAAGMLGREVTAACHARDHEVVALAHAALEITDPAAVDRALSRYRPVLGAAPERPRSGPDPRDRKTYLLAVVRRAGAAVGAG